MKKQVVLVLSVLLLVFAAMSVPKVKAATEQKVPEPLMPGVPADTYVTLEGSEAPVSKHPADEVGILHASYHHQGANTTMDLVAVYGQLYVTNPSVLYPSNDFYASRFLMKSSGRWIELGWAETGWTDPQRGGTYNQQWIYVYDTTHNIWEWDTTHRISPGQSIFVEIRHWQGNQWEALLWWNNAWVRLHLVDIGFSVADATEEYGEIYTPSGNHWFVPNTNFDNVKVLIPGQSSFVLWDTNIVPTYPSSAQYPYTVYWSTKYWKWYVLTLP